MISVNSFSKIYKSSPAVSGFSLQCDAGEITGILGPNGAGKTTILKAVCARHFASSGSVVINGVNVAENPEKVRNLTGFVMEQPNFPPELRVFEYLKMICEFHSSVLKKEMVQSKLDYVKTQFELESVWFQKLKNLSKGYQERVNFAQALVYNPPVLVLDEPASGLDPAQIINMRKMVLELKKNHTILLSTHLMQEVYALCDKVCIINHGKCVAFGTSEQIAAENNCDTIEEAFFKLTEGR